ncbi:cytochrome c [Pontibacterium granulatum]|uniref:c-type cytochrome n=1 Tax=Pontibacterium granulatum TaxID=2036029 RepID=UPI00249BED77|nr:cytochrome c [Pontibacterium granulatum]MDI3326192.1 cytochrome c [Pontibacterium granulatum]
MDDAPGQPSSFSSNGERIYYTGKSQTGSVITYQSGTMHAQMHRTSCASCHGNDRKGQRLYPRFWIVAPPLTRLALFQDHDDGHGDHQSYDKESLKRAIRQGIDPSGEQLNSAMPRWQMSEEDMDDLVNFLMTEINDRKAAH